MKKITVVAFFILIGCESRGQESTDSCTRASRPGWEFLLDKIPRNLCLPKGMLLANAYPFTDINGDALQDVVIQYHKEGLSDGDTLFTGIYFMNTDSSFTLVRKLGKLDPLYFEIRSPDYYSKMRAETGNLYLYDTLAGKHGYSPNNKTVFNKAKIEITMEPGVGDKYLFEYTYNSKILNWQQTRFLYYEGVDETVIHEVDIPDPAPLITDFNIADYM